MVDLERRLDAVVGDRAPGEHGAGVVDEHVDLLVPLQQVAGQRTHRVQGREVGAVGVHAGGTRTSYGVLGGLQPLRVPADEHQVVPVGRELE